MAGDLYLLVGFPGSGKTTWASNKVKDGGFASISTDELVKMFKNLPKEKRRQFEIELAKEHLQKGNNVILDKMLMSSESRKKIIETLRPYAKKIIVVLFNVPLLKCLERNSKRSNDTRVSDRSYISHIKRFEYPDKIKEKFDELIEIKS
ncbi:MAG: ATP-binding protein [candidate division WOR-3 bacterium]